jgi:hypothetical protein
LISSTSIYRLVLTLGLAISVAACLLAAAGTAGAAPGVLGQRPVGIVDTTNGQPLPFANPFGDWAIITGYAVDPDTPSTAINVRVDVTWYAQVCSRRSGECFSSPVGAASATATAYSARNDLMNSPYGPNHGFVIVAPDRPASVLVASSATLCVTAIDSDGTGRETGLGCFPVPSGLLYWV